MTEYDEFGRVTSSTDSLGRQNVTEYDPLGRVSRSVSNWVNGSFDGDYPDQDIETRYQYDAVGNTIIVTDTVGQMHRTFYDPLNRVAGTITNWSGTIDHITNLSDCLDLPAERDDDVCTLYKYDEVGNTIIITNSLKQMSRTFYDELNRVEATVANWNPDTLTDPAACLLAPDNENDENVCTLYGYDAAGSQVTTTNALNQTSLTVYDAANRPFITVQTWDSTPIASESDCSFPPAQLDTNLCHVTYFDNLGRRSASRDPLGHLTEFAYDGLGRVVTTTRYLDNEPVTTVTTYDTLGNRLSQADANGNATTFAYDSLNRLQATISAEGVTITQTYNAAGWLLATTNGLGHQTANQYDQLGRTITTTDAEGNTTTYEYDGLGSQVALIDAENVRTGYRYDGLNRLVGVVENETGGSQTADSNVLTQYRYDALGNRTVITNALNVTVTLTTYDGLNRPVVVEDALGNRQYTQYNALGHRTVMTDANGAVTTYHYDGLNRLVEINYVADGETVRYSYDALGNRTAMTDTLGVTSYIYDSLNRPLTITDPFTGTVGYGYDLVGNRTHLIYPHLAGSGQADNKAVIYTYDKDNRLVRVEDWTEGITAYEYDAAGRLISTTLPNGVVTTNQYDNANRLTRLSHDDPAAGTLLADYRYQLDGVGNRRVVTETMRLPGDAPPVTPSGNLLQNPGFEEGLTGWQDWGNLLLISDTVHSGALALRVGEDGGGSAQKTTAQPGLTYVFTGWTRLDEGNQAWVVLTFYDAGETELNDHGLALTATTGYQPFTVLAIAPPETAQVQAWLWKDAGSGYLLVDELSLVAEPNLLQNPGFEEGLSHWFQSGEVSLSSQAHSGAAALRLGTDSGGSWQSPAALAGEPYHFSGWTWLDGSDDAWAGLTFYDAGWSALAEESQLLLPAGSYQPFTIQAEAPAGTAYAGTWLWKDEGESYLYADDLSLVLVRAGETVSTTIIHYAYDRLYRLTGAVYSGDLTAGYSYVYDSVGNMTAYTETIGAETTVVRRSFDPANRLSLSNDGTITTTYSYDNNGNLRAITTPAPMLPGGAIGQGYSYDQRNLLRTNSTISSVNQILVEFVYDGDGHRVQQIDRSGGQPITTTYSNDNSGLSQVLVSDDGTTQIHNLLGLSLIQQDDGSQTRTLLADGLGSVRVEMVGGAVASGTVYGYTGEQHDAATGLVYLRARYYNPNLKLFMSRDPFPGWQTVPASQHGYSYVHNNPVNLTDPSGEFVPLIPLIVGGLVIGTVIGVTWDVMVTQGKGGLDNLHNILNPHYYCDVNWGQAAFTGVVGGIIGTVVAGGAAVVTRALRPTQVPFPEFPGPPGSRDGPGEWGTHRGPKTGPAAEYEKAVRRQLGGPEDKNYYAPDGKAFDAWNPKTGSYVDAKYAEGHWYSDSHGLPSYLADDRDRRIIEDANNQVEQAGPYSVEWWVSSPEGVTYFERLFEKEGLPIKVVPFRP